MDIAGYLFLAVNGGPVVSVPVTAETGRLMLELWFGDRDAEDTPSELRGRIEAILTSAPAG